MYTPFIHVQKEEVPNQIESNNVPESTVEKEGGQKVSLQPTANHPLAASPTSVPDSVKVSDTIPSQTSPILTARRKCIDFCTYCKIHVYDMYIKDL